MSKTDYLKKKNKKKRRLGTFHCL